MDESNDKNRLEDYLKRLIDEFDESPSDDVWKNIDANLDEDRKGTPLFWWMGAAAGLILLLLFTGYQVQQSYSGKLKKLEARIEAEKSLNTLIGERLENLEKSQRSYVESNEKLSRELEGYAQQLALIEKNNKSREARQNSYSSYWANEYVRSQTKRESKLVADQGRGSLLTQLNVSNVQDAFFVPAMKYDSKASDVLLAGRSDMLAEMMSKNTQQHGEPSEQTVITEDAGSAMAAKSVNGAGAQSLVLYADLGHAFNTDAWRGANHQTGLMYHHNIGDRLSAFAGLGYWEKNEAYDPKNGQRNESSSSNIGTTQSLVAEEIKQNNDMLAIPIGLSYKLAGFGKWDFGLSAQWTPVANITEDLVLEYTSGNSPTSGPFQDRLYSNSAELQWGTGRTAAYAQFSPEVTAIRFEVFYDRWLSSSDSGAPFQQLGLSAKLFFHTF